MKFFAMASTCLLLMGSTAVADSPLNGNWDSTDIGGPVDVGRYTESWANPDGAQDMGATIHGESWDGATLGGMWRYECATLTAPAILLVDNVDSNGYGNRTYMKTLSGGFLWLSGSGPWANGDPDYPGIIDSCVVFETIQYQAWNRVHLVANIQAAGHFDNYPDNCVTFGVANGVEIGSTDFGETKPATYPDYLQSGTCAETSAPGAWGDVITLNIAVKGCIPLPVQATSWGAVKALYE